MTHFRSAMPLAALLAFPAACAFPESEPSTGEPETAVATTEIGGSNAALTAVGELEAVVNIGNCSGTLISEDTVITAGHCVCGGSGTFPATGCNTVKTVTFTNVLPVGSSVRRDVSVTADVLVNPDFNNGGWLTNDYTLLKLRTRADQLVQVTPIWAWNQLPTVGEADTLVGYGGTSAPCDGSFGTKRKGVSVLDNVAVIGGAGGRTLTYNDTTVLACPGDSGGAAISNRTGRLLGVCSHGDFATNSNYDPTFEAWAWIRANACTQPDAAATSGTCRQGPALATGFSNASFSGFQQAFSAGRWPVADLGEIGNDQLSSLIVGAGAIVRLWAEGSCWGDTAVFTASTADVGTLLNNRASCVEVTPGATLYAATNFGGAQQTFASGGYNHAQLGPIGNDNAESIFVAPGMIARVCAESGTPGTVGWGNCGDFAGSVASLGTLANNVSNIEVAPAVTVYRDANFSGVSQTLRPGVWGAAALTIVGNDLISSLVVGPGLQARICSEDGNWGDCQTYTGAVSAVTAILNDRTSSIEITAIP
jgi:hypothetical protein